MKVFKDKPQWIMVGALVALLAVGLSAAFFAGRAVERANGPVKTNVPGDPTGIADPAAAMDGSLSWEEGGTLGYAANVVTDDPETLQQMVDEMMSKPQEGVSLEYKNVMVSNDGVNFNCYIANSADNAYDMFVTIYSDPTLTHELYRSELLRPGSRFELIAFKEQLDPGTYTGYLVHTQVYGDNTGGKYMQRIQAQVATTMDIIVNDYAQ